MKKTTCVIGATGLLGGYLCREFSDGYQLMETYHRTPRAGFLPLDIEDFQQIQDFFSHHRIDLVLFAAAMTHVDGCELDKEKCFRTNVEAVQRTIRILKETKNPFRFIFFSSEYVFDGKAGPYRDSDPPNPVSAYGVSKFKAERIIQQELDDFLIIRATGVYGVEDRGKNFFYTVRRFLSQNQPLAVPSDQISTPTYAKHIAQAVRVLVERNQGGIFHFADGTLISRADFAKAIARRFGWNPDLIRPVPTEELKQKAKRPLKGGLIPSEILGNVPTLQESLKEFYSEWKGDSHAERGNQETGHGGTEKNGDGSS